MKTKQTKGNYPRTVLRDSSDWKTLVVEVSENLLSAFKMENSLTHLKTLLTFPDTEWCFYNPKIEELFLVEKKFVEECIEYLNSHPPKTAN
jgi:hypothetical protein